MSHRPAALTLPLFLALVSCSPEPRWIAVAGGGPGLALFDGHLQSRGTLPVAPQASALEGTADGSSIVLGAESGAESGVVTWLRRTDGAAILRREFGGPIRGVALDREGRRVFVLSAGAAGGLTILRADRLTEERAIPVCPEPVSLAFAPDGDRVYVTCRPGAVVEVDPKLQIVLRTALVGADSGRACGAGRSALSTNGTLLYVPCARTGQLLYLDRATLKPWDSVSVGVGAAVAVVTPGAVAVTLLPDSDRVVLVNLRSKALVATVATGPNPVDVALSASGRLALVVTAGRDGAAGALLEMDTQTGATRRRAALAPGARTVYVWPGRRDSRLYWIGGRALGR